jgi:hypothetical protein
MDGVSVTSNASEVPMPFFKTFLLAVCLTTLACSQPMPDPAVDETVRMPSDMQTNVLRGTPLVIEIPTLRPWASVEEFEREELPSWYESIRVVRWPSREPIRGSWFFARDYPATLTFRGSMPPGWYAIQVNFGTIVVPRQSSPAVHLRNGTAGQVLIDGWNTARLHVGSLPVVGLRGGADVPRDGRDGGGEFSLGVSEPIEFERDIPAADLLRVSVNGVPIRCQPYGPIIPAGRFLGASWTCETPPSEGTVRAELMPLTGASTPLRYGGEGGQPIWVVQTGEWFGLNTIDDSVFAEPGL